MRAPVEGDALDADGPSHVAWTRDGSELLVLNAKSGHVSFLDGATLAILRVDPVGADPRDLELTPDGRFALVPSARERSLVVIDVAARMVAAVVPLSGVEPYDVEVASDSTFAAVASFGDEATPSSVSVVDLAALSETFRFSVPEQTSYPDFWS